MRPAGAADRVSRGLRLNRLPYLVYRVAPPVGKASVKLWYHIINGLDRRREMVFMNYGFVETAPGAAQVELQRRDEPDRYCIQLYHHVAGAVDLSGLDVLEVGCGRGGGSSYVCRYLKPRSVIGLDLAAKAIEFCGDHHRVPNLSFRQGDAEALPFRNSSFDTVLNVESSHYYGSMAGFLREVIRVLKPGGCLLLTDFRDSDGMSEMRDQFRSSGFVIESERLITPNVIRALEQDSDRKAALIRNRVPWFLRSVFREFASTRGTASYESFRSSHWEYISFVLRKPTA